MSNEAAGALVAEAIDGLEALTSIKILITGYPKWLAITGLRKHGELLDAKVRDGSCILIGKDAIIGVRLDGDDAGDDD